MSNLLSSVNNRCVSRLLGAAHPTKPRSRQPQKPIHVFFLRVSLNITLETSEIGHFLTQEISWQMLATFRVQNWDTQDITG